MNSIVIIHNPTLLNISLNKILGRVRNKHKKDFIVFIGTNSDQEHICRKNKIFFLHVDIFAQNMNVDEASNLAAKLSKTWHRGLCLNYKEINFGAFFENNVYLAVITTLKSINVIQNILKELKSNLVYIIDSNETAYPQYNNLFFYLNKILRDNQNKEALCVKVGIIKASNSSAIYNKIKSKYFKVRSFLRKLANFTANNPYFFKGKNGAPHNGAKKIAFIADESFDENYNHLAEILKGNPDYEINFLFKNFNSKLNNGFDFSGNKCKKFFPPAISYLKEYKIIQKEIGKLKNEYCHKKLFVYKNCNFWKIVLNEVRYLFKARFYKIFGKIKYFENILLKENIKLLIGSESNGDFNKCLFLLAKNLKINTIDLQSDILVSDTVDFTGAYCTKMLVWDKLTALNLIESGNKSSRVEFVGNLKYAHYKDMVIPRKRQFCEKTGLNPKDKLILVALGKTRGIVGFNDPNCNNNLIRWALNLVENSEGIQVIFRPHNKSTSEDLRFLKKTPNGRAAHSSKVFIDEFSPVPELLKNINLFVCGASEILLDAIYFNKPVIFVNTGAKNLLRRYTEKSIMVEVSSERDFMKNVRLLLSSLKINKELEENRLKFIKEYFPPFDVAKQKTIQIVENMLN